MPAEFMDAVASEQNGLPRGTSPEEIEKRSLFHDAGLTKKTTTTTTATTTTVKKKSVGSLTTLSFSAATLLIITVTTIAWS